MTSFSDELTQGDRFTLDRAAEQSDAAWPPDCVERYSFYRRHGHCKATSMDYAVAWAKNTTEQAARRRRADAVVPFDDTVVDVAY